MGKQLFICTLVGSVVICVIDLPNVNAQSGANSRVPWTASQLKGTPEPPPPYVAVVAYEHLEFARPVIITRHPAAQRMIVVEQTGKVYAFDDEPQVQQKQLIADFKELTTKLHAVYGLAFHPQFQDNGYVFVCYVDRALDKSEGTRVSRFQMNGERINLQSELPILHWRRGGHNGGCLKFGPDGFLYITAGDSEVPTPPDPMRTGQDISNLMSSVMRIDVDHPDKTKGTNYRIPSDNPFVDLDGARGEIWAYGFRNPWKISFDRASGSLWVGDVGWELWEMIYRIEKGGNYGWSVMEGPQPVLTQQKRGPTPILPPTIQHPHSEAGSITGGMVYHGSKLPGLAGTYVYGDYQSGILWSAQFDSSGVNEVQQIASTPVKLVGFGEDHRDELLLLDHGGKIYRLKRSAADDLSDSFPQLLSDTGLFDDVVAQRPAAGVHQYSINAHHWADFTHSERWIAMPEGTITENEKGGWVFPEGSVFAKTVSLSGVLSSSDATAAKTIRLETQILHRYDGAWRPYTYVWNEAQTDAQLLGPEGKDQALRVRDDQAPGSVRHQEYRFVSRRECQLCHNPWVEARTTVFGLQSASPLGVHAEQLKTGSGESGASDTLMQWKAMAMFNEPLARKLVEFQPLVDPYDDAAEPGQRARAYLHVNCAHCHQYNAGGAATILLAHHVKPGDSNTIGHRPTQGAFGISGAQIISPGDPFGSVLYYRLSTRGGGRMPRVGSKEVDMAGSEMIYEWIRQMEPAKSQSRGDLVVSSQDSAVLNASASEREDYVRSAVKTTRGALGLMRLVSHADIDTPAAQQIIAISKEHPAAEIRDLFERFLPPDQRVTRLGEVVDAQALLSMASDSARGKQIFKKSAAGCSNCHRIAGVATEESSTLSLGPDLTEIGKKYNRRHLLTHILNPSLLIEPKYVPWLVETISGEIISGLLVEDSEQRIVIRDAKGKLYEIAKEDIEQQLRSSKSIMPELLLKDLTPQAVADLLAYLSTLK